MHWVNEKTVASVRMGNGFPWGEGKVYIEGGIKLSEGIFVGGRRGGGEEDRMRAIFT